MLYVLLLMLVVGLFANDFDRTFLGHWWKGPWWK